MRGKIGLEEHFAVPETSTTQSHSSRTTTGRN